MVDLIAGQSVAVVKARADGSEAIRYPGIVIANGRHDDWVVVEARWTTKRIVAGGLVFEVGDRLLEWFSPTAWFNVFHVFAPNGTHRGWYANVTRPTRFESGGDTPLVVWPDLYLDLIAPAGEVPSVYDAEELDASGLQESDPELVTCILATIEEMKHLAADGAVPFDLMELGGLCVH